MTRTTLAAVVIGGSLAAGAAYTQRLADNVPAAARPLPLTAVRLTGGPLKHAQDLNARYLLVELSYRFEYGMDGRKSRAGTGRSGTSRTSATGGARRRSSESSTITQPTDSSARCRPLGSADRT